MNNHNPTTPNDTGWFKSTHSNASGACVEVKFDHDRVHIRDSKYRRSDAAESSHEPIITITAHQWPLLLDEIAGRTPTDSNGAVTIFTDNGHVTIQSTRNDTLTFTTTEWQAFTDGIHANEFNHPKH